MGLGDIKTGLVGILDDVSGVIRVYENPPDVAPTSADCPFILLDLVDPFITPNFDNIGHIYYTYHFKITFGLRPLGIGKIESWYDDIEPYPARVAQALAASPNVSATAMDITFLDVTFGSYALESSQYFAFQMGLDVIADATF